MYGRDALQAREVEVVWLLEEVETGRSAVGDGAGCEMALVMYEVRGDRRCGFHYDWRLIHAHFKDARSVTPNRSVIDIFSTLLRTGTGGTVW